jgi:hypothetical protein
MNLVRVFGDKSGETHLSDIELPPAGYPQDKGSSARLLSLSEIPATTVTIAQLLDRRPDNGLHTAPRRQVVAVLRGALQVTTTTGDSRCLRAGDCLLADDVDSKGHITTDVGDEPLATLVVGIDSEWQLPGADHL